ncbi:DUF1800 domain-containing protein [Verticiella sediminum]|nr:DUF1800 domain-containing protein [Verticiella sediminum]
MDHPTHRNESRLISRRKVLAYPLCHFALSLSPPISLAQMNGRTSAADRAFVNRITWGLNSLVATTYAQEGRNGFAIQQLRPGPAALPVSVQERLNAMELGQTPADNVARSIRADEKRIQAAPENEARQALRDELGRRMQRLQSEALEYSLLRHLHSPHQFQERLTWFWTNHFNVSIRKAAVSRVLAPNFEEHAIRPHVFGRFEDLLMATLRHPAMLIYLDNFQNRAGKINENYGRELMELHTLGVDGGYTQADVTALSRSLTGLAVNYEKDETGLAEQYRAGYEHDGLFEFRPERHDASDKVLLGKPVKGGGMDEVQTVVRRLARHPSTARHISRKLATWLVADEPPEELVKAMTATYSRTGGDLSAVLRTMLGHQGFEASLDDNDFKDPMRYVLGGMRMLYDSPETLVVNAQPLIQWLSALGQAPFMRDTPDGYPIRRTDWQSSGQMAARFDVAQRMAAGPTQLFFIDSPPNDTKPLVPDAGHLLYDKWLANNVRPATRQVLAQARTLHEWNVLWLASPDFMHA